MSISGLLFVMIMVGLCIALPRQDACETVKFDPENVIALSKTITTLQVVANPLLNPETSPVAKRAWQSLANLEADLVRYVPWFPYPKVAVAELDPPSNGQTHWNFDGINPQLEQFISNTIGRGHTAIPNFSTQPTWMFNTSDWSYPADTNKVDWNYPRGGFYTNTTANVAAYYGRLLSWMTRGQFTDEMGRVHTGGHNYPLTHWEVFNEVEYEHSMTYTQYTSIYDAVVKEIRRVADPQKKIQFVGLALAGREIPWISYFLDNNNHDPAALPLNYISFHFYAGSSSRTDPFTYEEFYILAEYFLEAEARPIAALRDAKNPSVKMDVDEIGCILSDDNDERFTPFPYVYWNACGSMYAYLYARMVPMGYDVLGQSQLAGSPAIPEWQIPDAQFPSVSLLNWTTGEGNPRYWILKLLLDNFEPGDKFLETTTTIVNGVGKSPMCPEIPRGAETGHVHMKCVDPNAVIDQVQFASYGLPYGVCGNYQVNKSCDANGVLAYVRQQCLGKNQCNFSVSAGVFGDPCRDIEKSFVVQATCSGTSGGIYSPPYSVFSQAIVSHKTGKLKILLINRRNQNFCVTVPNSSGKMMHVIDEENGDHPARAVLLAEDIVPLAPFAVAVIDMN